MVEPAQQGKKSIPDWLSIVITVSIGLILAIAAWFSYQKQMLFILAFSLGGIGGLIHDIAQSRGKLLFIKSQPDGLYLGTVAGVLMGAVAGIVVIRGYLTGDTPTTDATFVNMSYEAFLAGLALKGVAEAAGTKGT